jgi:hypothetical protein
MQQSLLILLLFIALGTEFQSVDKLTQIVSRPLLSLPFLKDSDGQALKKEPAFAHVCHIYWYSS